jgi:hypothetical protein
MRKLQILCIFLILNSLKLYSQKLPVGYIEQFSNPCNNNSFFKTFTRNDSSLWKIGKDASLKILPAHQTSVSNSIGVLDQMIFGEYILEFDFRIDNPIEDSAAFSFLGSIKSIDSYYAYSFYSDSIGFFLFKKGNKSLIDIKPIQKMNPAWNKARIEWNILTRNTTIIINNDMSRKLIFNNSQLVMGFVGFANCHSLTSIKNIKIWAPTSITDQKFIW